MIERKWLVTIVVISVALNLLLVGFYIGQQPLPGRTNVSIDPTMGLPRVLQGLPEDRRRALLQDVDVSRREIASRHRALQKVQIDIERAMAMEPFDAESLANALENFRRRFDENQEDSHRLLVQLFEQIDPEERRAVRIALSQLRARPNQGRPRELGPDRLSPRFDRDRRREQRPREGGPERRPGGWNRPLGGG
ncbi:MAG: periplasmic heavy metal sensor [Pseudomonadales bacterium]|nr:periplasmic heavy metal sensor [Pseudomonadales bacterium]